MNIFIQEHMCMKLKNWFLQQYLLAHLKNISGMHINITYIRVLLCLNWRIYVCLSIYQISFKYIGQDHVQKEIATERDLQIKYWFQVGWSFSFHSFFRLQFTFSCNSLAHDLGLLVGSNHPKRTFCWCLIYISIRGTLIIKQ